MYLLGPLVEFGRNVDVYPELDDVIPEEGLHHLTGTHHVAIV